MKGVPFFTHERAMMQESQPSRGFNAESRRQLSEADPRWKVKTIMRAIIILFSLIGLSLFAAAIPIWDRDFYWAVGPNSGDWEDGFPLGILVFTLLWNVTAMFLLLHLKLRTKPYIPLILDFLSWAALIPAITWCAGLGMFLYWNQKAYYELYEPYVWDIINKIGGLELGGIVFACFVWALEVILFIMACIETHKWRRARRIQPPSTRALDHGEYAQDADHNDDPLQRISAPPPKYEEDAHGIEMSPTSPTAREFV